MTATPSRPATKRPTATPEEIAEAIAFLDALPAREFDQALADSIMSPPTEDDVYGHDSPDPISQPAAEAAFRDPKLLARSVVAASNLLNETRSVLRNRAGADASNKDLRRRTDAFINQVNREREVLRQIAAGLKAQRGILDNSPNPRARAAERLISLNMQGDVPKGTFRALLEEEKQKVKDAEDARKRARKAERDAQRAAGRRA